MQDVVNFLQYYDDMQQSQRPLILSKVIFVKNETNY